MIIIDNFLDSYDELKRYSLSCRFEDVANPVDGVIYPNICTEIPKRVQDEILSKINTDSFYMFLRMSPRGVRVPHIAHTDNSMGDSSLMLYLNDGVGGTSLLRHKLTGCCYAPEDPGFAEILSHDVNNQDSWAVTDSVDMVQNRALIFDAHRFHRADPVFGFGSDQSNSRIVLTCFYDKSGD